MHLECEENNHSPKPVLPVKWNLGVEMYIK
nr:MAG TPA: hypothetical protein [Caudoviricetes sp.]